MGDLSILIKKKPLKFLFTSLCYIAYLYNRINHVKLTQCVYFCNFILIICTLSTSYPTLFFIFNVSLYCIYSFMFILYSSLILFLFSFNYLIKIDDINSLQINSITFKQPHNVSISF